MPHAAPQTMKMGSTAVGEAFGVPASAGFICIGRLKAGLQTDPAPGAHFQVSKPAGQQIPTICRRNGVTFGCPMRDVRPVKPSSPDPLAAELLAGLSGFPCARSLVLGGYFALKHYCDCRATHDLDAWWDATAGEGAKAQVRAVLREVLTGLGARHGLELSLRRFGDTESWELSRAGKKVFSFQVSTRTVQLAPKAHAT